MREIQMTRVVTLVCFALCIAVAQGQTTQPSMREIDACGVLVQGAGCVLFEGGGGTYVVVASGDFQFGDAVRVVGTVDTGCITICPEADGCIRGATLYDPAVLPCGTDLPNLPADLVSGLCSTISASLLMLTAVGLWCTARAARAARTPSLPSP
jgi:hypothetical protein